MNAERLLEHYERIADAPDAIARLRRFILDLAVRGKLVPQDPEDEPAPELLKRIAKEKARLAGKIGKLPEPELRAPRERPFPVPQNWDWVQLDELLVKLTDGTHHSPPNSKSGEFKYITAKNIKNEGVSLDDITYVTPDIHREIYRRCNPEKGDILYIKDGATTGIVTINDLDEQFSMLSSVALLKLPPSMFNRLIVEFLRSPFFYEQMRGFMKGAAITRVTLKRMAPALIPLPPLAEQHRIVAKVDELMALCDRLEAARTEREKTRDKLAEASLARLNVPNPETFEADARFALDALPVLTTRPDQIKALRQTILNLAVRGKLVPQDPKDEPAIELLKRISKKKDRTKHPVVAIAPDDEPYPLPETWKWATLDQLIVSGPQNGISPKPTDREDAPKAITLTATTSGAFNPAYFKHVEASIPKDSEFWLSDGDLLFQRGNTREYVGMAAVYRGPPQAFLFPDLIMKVRVSAHVCLEFAHLASISPPARNFLSANASGAQSTMPKINQTTLVSLPIPLPPLAEQHRIVAKIDELMALCDKLEASLTTADDTRRRLLDALLAEALAPANTLEREAAE